MKTFVIGDIHGGLRGLKQVLERMHFQKEDRFIFVGDYVDGWSESAETVQFLLEFSDKQPCIFLRGNHEELLYDYLKHNNNNPVWLLSGGLSTKKSYATLSSEKLKIHILFYENLLDYFVDENNNLFIHAGFINVNGPEHEYYPDIVRWDRTLWEMVRAMDLTLTSEDENYPKRLKLFKEIFIGHTPISKNSSQVKPKNFANVWNLDTGAAYKGPVTIMDVETKEIWQSDPVWKLYPEENGRN